MRLFSCSIGATSGQEPYVCMLVAGHVILGVELHLHTHFFLAKVDVLILICTSFMLDLLALVGITNPLQLGAFFKGFSCMQ